ncbi:hypothetical protein VOM14_13505 [Paraburkholderia sp. MPAMCS5]|uniref:hypothetical protein n=1 Tax=Paraburkholderia sp. MPAMCS5 TaxID=3112563 RepID=UPI002E175693|nr:hypothetical protein [Paraburkholderia sp. MPAMCS5]
MLEHLRSGRRWQILTGDVALVDRNVSPTVRAFVDGVGDIFHEAGTGWRAKAYDQF